jgi:putative glutamine amidotransferase
VPDRFDAGAHHVEIVPGSRLAKVLDSDSVDVNTLHHQAIERCADDLVVVGRDQHGVIEAAEHPEEPILGVQWHPELITHVPPHEQLFRWVVDEARAGAAPGRS